ncbi:MAG: fibronectin type III domain-containing protein [Crocinitomicaceae bacterium]|nr:fibronectin type III domain-containing protein [Crocinitomicaceae bacterium]MBK8927814.1 fibronectin type III domain-containing protein [Crocinitomicaceae bacterium]
MQITNQTFINYGITEPQLQIGMSYAWRVRAQDMDGHDFFRNNGYSSVCTFTYGNIASSVADGITLTLNSNGIGTRVGYAWWNVSSTFTHYKLELRKTGNPNYVWFPYESTTGELKIYQLEPATQYECRVKGCIDDDFESEWSNVSVFTTQPVPDYACGSTTTPPLDATITPLTNAIAGMTFTIGQFEMLVTDIQPLDPVLQPGHYSGTGKIQVGFALINLRVKFDDILVDEYLMVRSGKVEAITQGMDQWIYENVIPQPDYFVDGTITDFSWNDSTSITVWVDGVAQSFNFQNGEPIIIQDDEGMIYTFNADGTYSVVSTLVYSSDYLAATKDYRIDFEVYDEQEFGFDKKEYAAWISNYEVIRLLDSTNYFVAYKSLAPDQSDYVIASIKSENQLSGLSFVALENGSERQLTAEEINDTTYKILLDGMSSSCYVYAKDNELRIGKLWVKVLEEISFDVVLVPVNGATLSQIENIENQLNEIYAQANVTFNVTIAENYNSTTWDLNADGKLQNGDISLVSHYSDEMRLLREQYFESDSADHQNKYYLFIIPEFYEAELEGYMVRGKALGFLKTGENAITAAHELAHGIFSLEHTFPQIAQGTTPNLLDYSGGTHLTQKQWQHIHSPLPAFSFLDDEEGGEHGSSFSFIADLFSEEPIQSSGTVSFNCSQAFYSKFNHYIELPTSVMSYITDYYFSDGKLKGFRIIGHPIHEDGYYTLRSGVFPQNQIKTNGTIQILERTGSTSFVKNIDLTPYSRFVNDPTNEAGFISYAAISPDGSIDTLFRNIPSTYKINATGRECQSGDIVVYDILNNEAQCHTLTETECQTGTDWALTSVSPDDEVKLLEIDYTAEYYYASTNYSWLNAQLRPVITSAYTDLIVAESIRSFKLEGIIYCGITINRRGDDIVVGYVNRDEFIAREQSQNESLKIRDIEDIIFSDFEFSNIGDLVHYRYYVEYGDCVGYSEYEFVYDGRDHYVEQSTPVAGYYFADTDAEIVANNSCSLELFGDLMCDALNMGAEGIGQMVDYLFSVALIPPEYWDPTEQEYNDLAFSIYAAVSTGTDFFSLNIEAKQKSFAFMCGVWNGFVNEIGGIGLAMAMLAEMVCNANTRTIVWEGVKKVLAIIAPLVTFGIANPNPLLDYLNSVLESWMSMNEFQRQEFLGRQIAAIISAIFPVSKAKWVSAFNKGAKAFEKLSSECLTFFIKVKNHLHEGFEILGDDIRKLVYNSNQHGALTLASVSDDGILIIEDANRWFDSFESSEVVDDLGQVEYKIGENGLSETDELVVVKKQDGTAGIGRRDNLLPSEVINATQQELEQLYESISNSPPAYYLPGTIEHKSERWAQYKLYRGEDAINYQAWSNIYNANINKANIARQIEVDYINSIGWGNHQYTINAGSQIRRLDIADPALLKAVEIKSYESGRVYATQAIRNEIIADSYLVNVDGWEIEWVFKGCDLSQPLRQLLEAANINITIIP